MKSYALFVGVDISKNWIDVALTIDGHKQRMLHGQFANRVSGFNSMLRWIKRCFVDPAHCTDKWLFCMEHTGVYSVPLTVFLEQHQLAYVLESALRIKRSLGLKRGKDDKTDAKDIARYVFLHRSELKISKLPGKTILKIKNLLAFRSRLVKHSKALRAPCSEMTSFQDKELLGDIVADTQQVVQQIKRTIRKVEQQLKQLLAEDPQIKRNYDLARSVKGIGLVCAAYMIVYTNNFEAFDSWRKFACYISIAPFPNSSGKTEKPAKVSFLGHKKLKALLSNAIASAIKHDKELKAYYLRKIGEGKQEGCVLNAVKNKLISRVFAVVKRGTPYVEFCTYA